MKMNKLTAQTRLKIDRQAGICSFVNST